MKSKRVCPRDGAALQEVRYEGILVDRCGLCGGYWCDPGELEQILILEIVQFSGQAMKDNSLFSALPTIELAARPAAVKPLCCVTCQGNLITRPFAESRILIDICPQGHGVWLDHREIERVQMFAEMKRKNIDSAKIAEQMGAGRQDIIIRFDRKKSS